MWEKRAIADSYEITSAFRLLQSFMLGGLCNGRINHGPNNHRPNHLPESGHAQTRNGSDAMDLHAHDLLTGSGDKTHGMGVISH
jgi:hypothetical protein